MEATPLQILLESHGKEPQTLFSIPDSADILLCTVEALMARVHRGSIAAVKRSPRRYAGISYSELDRYLTAAQNMKKEEAE